MARAAADAGWDDHPEMQDRIAALARVAGLRDLPPAVLTRLDMLARERRFAPDEPLGGGDEPCDRVYILIAGSVCLDGTISALLAPGAVLGTAPNGPDDECRWTAWAVGEVRALMLHRTALALVALQYPAAAEALRRAFGIG